MRIAVVSDPHVATRSTGTDRVFHQTEERLLSAIGDINDRDVDCVLFPGDLTKDGEPWNYEGVDELLEISETGTDVWLVSHADLTARREAYQLAATGPAFRRTLLGLIENALEDAPLIRDPPRVERSVLSD